MTSDAPEAPREDIETELPDDVESLRVLVLQQQAQIEHLRLLIAKLRRMQFGRSSERLERQIEQMELRLEELQSTQTALPAAPKPKAEQKSHPVRRPLPEHLPREQVVRGGPKKLDRGMSGRTAPIAGSFSRSSIDETTQKEPLSGV